VTLSRPRSSRGNTATARPAARAGRPGVFVATPKSDVYVALLGVSLGSMVLASLLLTWLLYGYDFKVAVG
jgi:hypothetical protein